MKLLFGVNEFSYISLTMNTMKTLLYLLVLPFFFYGFLLPLHAQGTAINTSGAAPDASAILDVSSTVKGFLPPRLTSLQRDAIPNPANGLVVFNTDMGCLNYYFSNQWHMLCGSPVGQISSLSCGNASTSAVLISGQTVSGVQVTIPYVGGNGGMYQGLSLTSTGVANLTLSLSPGSFSLGPGNLVFSLTGTPASSGSANFVFSIGGQSCNVALSISPAPTYPQGTVHCQGQPTQIQDVLNPVTGRTWMDRNLGASQVATSPTDVLAYGDLYQWGRPADGHQCRNSMTTTVLSSTPQPAHGLYIVNNNLPALWMNYQEDNLWQGVSGINNPCPSGYRIPTVAELEAERLSWSTNNAAGAFNSPLKWSLGGMRNPNGLLQEGVYGHYWASNVNSSNARKNFMFSSNASEDSGYRSFGYGVRCIKN
jgi:hypothetical protein